ncbi:cell division cycle-associated protein 2-like [Pseudonaja textilis]|uniref:cell division cycle-associated protein 2-like n=1 Tax=Pseudonaja textilis TaxID=8673 RepID=UPI000EA987C5|nr:cell division cycle-associated protein 2-like [Pseudonaja textilis]
MENQNTKKVLSECSNTQPNLYLGCGNPVNSMKKMDFLFTSGSSDAPAANLCTSTAISESLVSTRINNPPIIMNDTDDLTTSRRKSTNVEIASNQVTPSRGLSDCVAVDYKMNPELFTSQNKEEFKHILKKLRRRSTIGARGSPENNHLIQYIARQRRMKVQENLSQSSPCQDRNTLLKDKIAAFQSSFKALEETEEKAVHIHSTSNTRLHEQSTLSQTWSPEDMNDAFEENLTDKCMNGEGISVDIQMHSPKFPSWKPLLSGTNVMSKAVLVSPANAVESTGVSLVATPSTGISKSESGEDKKLSRNDTSQPSNKKVQFSEKQSFEIFDESKPPITPVGKGHSFPNSLRSVLKKTPVKIVSEGLKDLQGSSGEMATPICTGSFGPEERKNNSPDHHAPLIRTARNSDKRKCAVKAKKIIATKIEGQNQLSKLQKAKPSTKSKKTPAVRPKAAGKRRGRGKKKEEQKVFYGPRERILKKPLLSPILEITENASFRSSYPNTPSLNVSTSDDSSSDLHAKFIDDMMENKTNLPHAVGVDSHDQPSSPQEEDGLASSSVQLQELALNNGKQWFPGYVPEKISPEKLKSSLNGNEQVVGRDCLSSRTEMQLVELLNICGPTKNIKAKENSFFTVDFSAEVMSESNGVSFERNPRISRKSTEDFLNPEGTKSNSPGVPGGNLDRLPSCPWTADDIALLNHFEENRNITKKVRRSMRGQKDAKGEGLAWVEIPCKVPKRLSSVGPQESKYIVSKPYGPRRRSFCASEGSQLPVVGLESNTSASHLENLDKCQKGNMKFER